MKLLKHFGFDLLFQSPLREKRSLFLERVLDESEIILPEDEAEVITELLSDLEKLLTEDSFLERLEHWKAKLETHITGAFQKMYPDKFGEGRNKNILKKRVSDIIKGLIAILPNPEEYQRTRDENSEKTTTFQTYENILQEYSDVNPVTTANEIQGGMTNKDSIFNGTFAQGKLIDLNSLRADIDGRDEIITWLQTNKYEFHQGHKNTQEVQIFKDGDKKNVTLAKNGLKRIWPVKTKNTDGAYEISGVVILDGDGDLSVYQSEARRIAEISEAVEPSDTEIKTTVLGKKEKMKNVAFVASNSTDPTKQEVEKILIDTLNNGGVEDAEIADDNKERTAAIAKLVAEATKLDANADTKDGADRVGAILKRLRQNKTNIPGSWVRSINGNDENDDSGDTEQTDPTPNPDVTDYETNTDIDNDTSSEDAETFDDKGSPFSGLTEAQVKDIILEKGGNSILNDVSIPLIAKELMGKNPDFSRMPLLTYGKKSWAVSDFPEELKATASEALIAYYLVSKRSDFNLFVSPLTTSQLSQFNNGKIDTFGGTNNLGKSFDTIHKYVDTHSVSVDSDEEIDFDTDDFDFDSPEDNDDIWDLDTLKSNLIPIIKSNTEGGILNGDAIENIKKDLTPIFKNIDFSSMSCAIGKIDDLWEKFSNDPNLEESLKITLLFLFMINQELVTISRLQRNQLEAFLSGEKNNKTGGLNTLGPDFSKIHNAILEL